MQLLDLPGERRVVHGRTVQQLIDGVIRSPDLHDVDAVAAGRGNLDKLPADILAGPVELMSFQRSDNKYFDIFAPHPGGKKLHGEGFPCTGAAQDCKIGIFILSGIKDICNNQGVIVFVDAK